VKAKLQALVDSNFEQAQADLAELVATPSVSGSEAAACKLVEGWLEALELPFERVPLSQAVRQHPEYLDFTPPAPWARYSLKAHLPGTAEGAPLILNSHLDTVPADEWPEAFTPKVEAGRLVGRGAVDAKGQVATLLLVARALRQSGVRLARPVEFHFAIEEEIGGNGSLALALQVKAGSSCVVLEPTSLNVHPANRGALWFKAEIEGKSVHMGRIREGVNALEKACLLMQSLREYGERLLEESLNYPGFERYEQPVQVNFGQLSGGDWPSTVAGWCVLEGGVGFLPNKNLQVIREDLERLVAEHPDEWLRTHTRLSFDKLHNEAFEFPLDHPLPVALHTALTAVGAESEVFGWNVSCDARLYAKVAGVPTVVFGPGAIEAAHSVGENMPLEQLRLAAKALVAFIVDWCGVEGE